MIEIRLVRDIKQAPIKCPDFINLRGSFISHVSIFRLLAPRGLNVSIYTYGGGVKSIKVIMMGINLGFDTSGGGRDYCWTKAAG